MKEILGSLEVNRIYQFNVLEGLKLLPDNCIDLIVTSPPYNKKSKNRKPHKSDTWSGGNAAISYGIFDDYMKEDEYQQWQIDIINECMRILKPKGSFFYNHKNRTINKAIISPYEWILKSNAYIKEEIVWDRKMIVEVDKVRFYPKTERVYWLIKDRVQPKFNGEFANLKDIWEITPCQKEKRHNHPAPYPEELPSNCILSTTDEGDVVLDPFMGSGTTAVVAVMNKRKFIGFELNPQYIEIANKRLDNLEINNK